MILAGIKAARVGASESLQSPSARMMELLGAQETASGQDVTESKAETLSAFYCGTRIISEMGSAGPVNTYENIDEQKKRKAAEHESYKLLTYPNDYQTGMALRESIWWCGIVWGDGLAEIERDGRDRPVAMHHIHTSRATLDNDAMRRGFIIWNVTKDNGGGFQVEDADMFHLKGPGDGIRGKPVVRILRETIGRAAAVREHGASWFKGGGRLQALLKHPAMLENSKIKGLVDGFQQSWAGGKDGTQKIGVLTGGLEFAQNLATTNEDAQFLETEYFGIEEVCRVLNIQPHILKHLLRATNNNIEQQALEFYTMTMLPWFRRFETEAEFKLIRKPDRGRFFVRHNADFILRGDYKSRMEGNAIAVQWGIDTIDEIRDRDDKNPHPNGQGAVPLIPSTHKPAQSLVQEARRAETAGADDIGFKREVVKALIADQTVGDAIANMTDTRDLLRQVNLPTDAGYDPPQFPIIAATGPVVNEDGTIERDEPPPDTGNGPPTPNEPDSNQAAAVAADAQRTESAIQALFCQAANQVMRMTVSKIHAVEKRDGDRAEFLDEHRSFVMTALAPVIDAAFVMRGMAVDVKAAEKVFSAYRQWIESFNGKCGKLIEQQGAGRLVAILAEIIK